MDELTISVTIADRPYRLTIKREEEEIIRKAANEINEKIKFYAEHFAYNDRQDLIAMVTLEKTTEALMARNSIIDGEMEMISKLSEVNDMLTENLRKD